MYEKVLFQLTIIQVLVAIGTASLSPKDCQDVYDMLSCLDSSFVHIEDVYEINPSGNNPIRARCILDGTTGTGWTVIQRRVNGSTSFQRTWEEYKLGFGDPRGNVWLGNEYVHQLTNQKSYKMKVVIQDWNDQESVANYDAFLIGSEVDEYKLTVNYMGGSAGDSLTASYHNGRKFSTLDRDNDDHTNSCSTKFGGGGWWFGSCHQSNLNGLYCYNGVTENTNCNIEPGCGNSGMDWSTYRNQYSLKYSSMLITPN